MMPNLDFLHVSLFYELAALLVLAAAIGLVGLLLRQPLIVSFIVCGILAGPSVLGIVQSPENIDLLAELGVAVLVGLVTIALSVYMITYSYALYRWLEPLLGIFERSVAYREQQLQAADTTASYDAILFGLGRYGTAIVKQLQEEQMRILAIDFNPDEVRRWTQMGYDTLYGMRAIRSSSPHYRSKGCAESLPHCLSMISA